MNAYSESSLLNFHIQLRIIRIAQFFIKCYTVEPLNKGHFGNGSFVLSSEVVPISEVHHVLIIKQGNKYNAIDT